MKYLAAYLLLTLAGNESPSADDVKGVLSAVGIDVDSDRIQKLMSELEGKDIQQVSNMRIRNDHYDRILTEFQQQLVSEGTEKLASVPSGGAAAAAAPAAGGAAAPAAEEKKEEKAEEESDEDMGFGLFD